MKYIDVEKLKEELYKVRQYWLGDSTGLEVGEYGAELYGAEHVLDSIDDIIKSLEQEQDCILINKKDWEAQEQFKKNKDFGKPLQEEQPKKSKKDCNGCPHCVDRKDQYGWHFKGCFGGPYKGKFIAEIDECPLEQEQPEVNKV